MSKFLDSVGLKHLWVKILAKMPKKVSQLENDANYITLKTMRIISLWPRCPKVLLPVPLCL